MSVFNKRPSQIVPAVLVLLYLSFSVYATTNKQFLAEVWATYTNKKNGPKVNNTFKVMELGKLLPLKKAYIIVDDVSYQFGNGKFTAGDINKIITDQLGIQNANTKYGAPQIYISFIERSAAPFHSGTFVWTKLTLAAPQNVLPDGREEPLNIVYSSERGGIYEDAEKVSSLSAIDTSVRRLQGLIGSLQSSDRHFPKTYDVPAAPIDGKRPILRMYSAPSKTIDGSQAPH